MEAIFKNVMDLAYVKNYSDENRVSFYQETRDGINKYLQRTISDEEFDTLITFSTHVLDYTKRVDPIVLGPDPIYRRLRIVAFMCEEEGRVIPDFLAPCFAQLRHRYHHISQ